MVMAIGLPAISKVTGQRISSTTRKFVGMVRTIRTDAILLNSIYRLAIDMEHNAYWVESQKEFKLLTSADQVQAPKKKGDKKEPPPSNFTFAEKYSKKPVELPGGVTFEGVFKEREGLVREGIAYIHFFPNGFNDQAIIYLGREGQTGKGYSLVVRPTSGRVDIVAGVVQNLEAVQ
jgi:hypothetical protein